MQFFYLRRRLAKLGFLSDNFFSDLAGLTRARFKEKLSEHNQQSIGTPFSLSRKMSKTFHISSSSRSLTLISKSISLPNCLLIFFSFFFLLGFWSEFVQQVGVSIRYLNVFIPSQLFCPYFSYQISLIYDIFLFYSRYRQSNKVEI